MIFNLTSLNILFVMVLLLFCITCYIEVRNRPRMQLISYYLLHLLALGLLFWLIQGFWKASYDEKKISSDVVILKDQSGSMELLPKKMSAKVSSFIKSLAKDLKADDINVTEYCFGSDVIRDDSAPKGAKERFRQATAIGNALLKVNQEHPGASVVLLSDGNENSGISALAAVHRVSAYMTHVFPVVCCMKEERDNTDLSVTNVFNVLNSWDPDYCCILQGAVEQYGRNVEQCVFQIKVDDQLVLSKELALKNTIQDFQVKVPLKKDMDAGWYEYSVTVLPVKNEMTELNNTAKGVFKVYGKDQINVIWQYWDLNLKYLKKLLAEKYGKNVNVTTTATFQRMTDNEQIKLINNSEFLIIGDVPISSFHVAARERLYKMIVKEKISTFFMNAGALKTWIQTPGFADIIPVRKIGKRLAAKLPWKIRFNGSSSPKKMILPVHTLYRLEAKKSSYVKMKAFKGSQKMTPVVVNRKRVTCFAPTSTWRWFLSPEKKVHFNATRFWNYILGKYSFLEQGQIQLLAELKQDVMSHMGKRTFLFTAIDRKQDKIGGNLFLMRRMSKDDYQESRRFIKAENMEYRCELPFDNPGIYWYIAQKRDKNNRIIAQSKRVPVVIEDDSRETNAIADKTNFLADIAGKSNGKLFYLDQLDELKDTLKQPTSLIKLKKPQGNNYLFESAVIAAIIALLAAEWLLRQIEKKSRS